MEKFKKIDREFKLSDSSVNVYGFRLLSSGYLMDEYKKNPIGYYMHNRANGVLVKWDDLRAEGDEIFGKPVINLSHPRGEQTVSELENGFLNAASVGHLVALEISNDASLQLPNQTGPTVTKWYNRECSLVDIPGNMNAIALFDADENPINLSDFTSQKKLNMKQIVLTAAQLAVLNLKDDADATAVGSAFNDLVAKAAKVDQLTTENGNLVAAKKKAEDDLADLKAETVKEAVKTTLATALGEGRITKEASEKLAVDYSTNLDGLKNLIAALPVYKSISAQIEKTDADQKLLASLVAMSWDELFEQGKLEDLKAKDIEAFKAKYKETFNKEYAA